MWRSLLCGEALPRRLPPPNAFVAVLHVIDFELNQAGRDQQLGRTGSSHIYPSQRGRGGLARSSLSLSLSLANVKPDGCGAAARFAEVNRLGAGKKTHPIYLRGGTEERWRNPVTSWDPD